MANIKETLQTFCRILNNAGFIKLTPEDFRRAKFGTNDEILRNSLWTLLIQIYLFHQNRSFPKILLDLEVKEKYLKMIKIYFTMNQITAFNNFTIDISSSNLLVMIGALMINQKFMENISLSFINSTLSLSSQNFQNDEEILNENLMFTNYHIGSIIFASRKANLKIRNLANSRRSVLKSLQKLSSLCSNKLFNSDYVARGDGSNENVLKRKSVKFDENFLFSYELFFGSSFKECLEINSQIIEDLTFWYTNGENIFWKWMESVLEIVISNKDDDDEQNNDHIEDLALHVSSEKLLSLAMFCSAFSSNKTGLDKVINVNVSSKKSEFFGISNNFTMPLFFENNLNLSFSKMNSTGIEDASRTNEESKNKFERIDKLFDDALNKIVNSAFPKLNESAYIMTKPFPT